MSNLILFVIGVIVGNFESCKGEYLAEIELVCSSASHHEF